MLISTSERWWAVGRVSCYKVNVRIIFVNGLLLLRGSLGPFEETQCGLNASVRLQWTLWMPGNTSGNRGSGISVHQGVDLVMSNASISNNTGDGVRVRRISIGDFSFGGNTVTGNGRASVSCDTTSLLVGDLSTFSNIACKRIERERC